MMEADTSFTEVDLKQDKFEDVREEGAKFHCDLCDKGMIHNIALVLIEGLSTACVDFTTGDIFKSPGTVAADIRKEMLEYLNEKSQSFVAESLILEGRPEEEISDLPSEIISDLIEDFTGLKRNLLSRVSGLLLSETREDKIDDFVQEMELNSFWLLDRREATAQALLKNVDFKNEYHCNMKFKSEVELEHHRLQCGFRTLLCGNQGCNATFSATHAEKHDSICPFKVLPCEQKCPEILLRRDMDKHCITVCPMKPVNCPFYSIGCKATIPSSNLKQHFSDDLHAHLILALLYLHKGASTEDVVPRAEQIKQDSAGRLAGTPGVRSFTNAVKQLDSKLEPLKIKKKQPLNEKDTGESEPENNSTEGSKNTISEERPALNSKNSDASDPVDSELKTSEAKEHSAEDVKTSDSGEPPAEDTVKPDSVVSPAAEHKNLEIGEPPVNDPNKSKEEDPKSSDFPKPSAAETGKTVPEAEETNKFVLEVSKTSDSGESQAEIRTKSNSDHAVVDTKEPVSADPKDSEEHVAEDARIGNSDHTVDITNTNLEESSA